MKKIFQNDLTSETGNCLQCCIASMFHWPIKEVPRFEQRDGNKQKAQLEAYMRNRGYITSHFFFKYDYQLTAFMAHNTLNEYVMLTVDSFHHEGVSHAVVGHIYNDLMFIEHDPNPKNNPIKSDAYHIVGLTLFIPVEEFYGTSNNGNDLGNE